MLIEVKVPQLSESVAEATLLAWHKKQGEAVKRDENLIDIETDKVVLELPAPADGVLVNVRKGDKSTVVAGEVIATIDTEGKASAVSPAAPVQAKPVAVKRGPRPRARPEKSGRVTAFRKRLVASAKSLLACTTINPACGPGSLAPSPESGITVFGLVEGTAPAKWSA